MASNKDSTYKPPGDFRVRHLPPYLLGEIANEVRILRSKGEEVVDLSQVNPNLSPPEEALNCLVQACLRPENHRYSSTRGIGKLRKAVAAFYKRKFNVVLDAENQICSTMATKEGLVSTLLSVVEHGGSVLLPTPRYPVHSACIFLVGAQSVEVPLFNDWPESPSLELDSVGFVERLKKAYSRTWPRPGTLIISFPNNPTSCTLELADLERIVDFARENSILIIHDFAYLGLEFEKGAAPSILQVPGAEEVAVELFSVSKGFSLPGWRVGFCLGNDKVISALIRTKSYTDFGIFQPLQLATAELLESGCDILEENSSTYQSRKEILVKGLREAGWRVFDPKAGLFVWASPPLESAATLSGQELALKILREAKVSTSPGEGFGAKGEGWLRFALVASETQIQKALRNISLLEWNS